MKVGIITLIGYSNYGNRLQNYAVQEVLKQTGAEVETLSSLLCFNDMNFIKGNYFQKIKNLIKSNYTLYQLVQKFKNLKLQKDKELIVKQKKFKEFTQKNINMSNLKMIMPYKKIDTSDFDYFVSGSDQVWNYEFGHGNWLYFLQFAPSQKRISYAASIGLDEIPKERIEQFKKYVSGMKYISVREQRAKEIIEELTDKKADVVLDPTMMLSLKQWSEISQKPSIDIADQYILLYFLGTVSDERRKFIENYAKENNCEVIDVENLKDSEGNKYIADPGEWVYLIANCEWMFTDSFHGCVFSIIHHRQFYVFHRTKEDFSDAGMFSRIETLTDMFRLESRIQEENSYFDKGNITTEEFEYIDKVIEYEKQRTQKLLKNAMR